jgi:hypothetical protein
MHARNLRPVCTSPAPILMKLLLTAISSVILFGLLAGSDTGISFWFPCGFLRDRDALSREINQSFNQKTPGVLSCSCEHPLARADFLQKLSGTYEPSHLRPFCYNIEKNIQHFLAVRITSDCSLCS